MACTGWRSSCCAFRSYSAAQRHARIQWWSAKLLRLMGIALHAHGTPRPGAKLVVSNHVSWLDIAAIHAVIPEAHFVSKADVKHWPLVGRLVAGAGTLFIEREKKRDALRVVHQMAEALKAGDTVAVFPEGTTGDGRTLLPFHANLLHAAVTHGDAGAAGGAALLRCRARDQPAGRVPRRDDAGAKRCGVLSARAA